MSDVIERGIPQQWTQYYDLYAPEGARNAPLVIAMHGYGGDKGSMMKAARRVVDDRFVIASLQAPYQHIVRPEEIPQPLGFGFGWVTNFKPAESIALHHDAVSKIVEDLSSEGLVDRSRTFLMGFSQAVALCFRYAFTYPERTKGVVAICGGIPGDWDEDKYRAGDVEVLYIAGREDEFYSPEKIESNAERLRERAKSVDLRMYEVGHIIPREANPDIAEWLSARA